MSRFLPTIEGLINEDPIFVVSVIGKHRCLNLETIERLIGLQPFKEKSKVCLETEKVEGNEAVKLLANKQSFVEHYYDRESSLLVLHLCNIYEFDQFSSICGLDQIQNLTPSEFHLWLEKQEYHLLKLIFFMFLVSHQILIVENGNFIDLQYLKMLRMMQNLRGNVASTNIMNNIADAIHASDIKYISPCVPGRWIPMLNFVFYQNRVSNRDLLESSLESQIRILLKKSRVHYTIEPGNNITSVNMNYIPLFGIDPNKLVYLCSSNATNTSKKPLMQLLLSDDFTLSSNEPSHSSDPLSKLAEYINKLVRYLLGNKEQRRQIISFKAWKVSCSVVEDNLFNIQHQQQQQQRRTSNSRYNNDTVDISERIKPYLDCDLKYSTNRCQQFMSIARSHYLSNLPPLYTFHQHETQLSSALQLFTQQCRGPALDNFINRFKEECLKIWKTRQLCDAKSCTGNPCTAKTETGSIHIHHNSIVYTHACSCGKSVYKRSDPFTLEDAYRFYTEHNKCCSSLVQFNLPNKVISANTTISPFSIVAHPVWELFIIGDNSNYDPKQGILQPGFMTGRNYLMLVPNLPFSPLKPKSFEIINKYEAPSILGRGDNKCNLGDYLAKLRKYKAIYNQDIVDHSSVISNTSSTKSRNKSNSKGRSRNKQSQSNNNNNVTNESSLSNNSPFYIGYEFECSNGHRFFFNKEDIQSPKNFSYIESPIPVFLLCRCGKSTAQLQRLFLVTPQNATLLTLDAKFNYTGKENNTDKWTEFGFPEVTLSLPANSFVVLRLPFIYMHNNQYLNSTSNNLLLFRIFLYYTKDK